MGELRAFRYELTSNDYDRMVYTEARIGISLFDHYPTVQCTFLDYEHINQIVEDHRANTLVSKNFEFVAEIDGVGSLVELDQMVINKVTPVETPRGLTAQINMIPRFALMSAFFPECLMLSDYGLTISESIEEILDKMAVEYRPTIQFGARDVISCVSPRFLNMSYLDMIGKICDFHGLHYFMDFDKNLWVYPGFKLNPLEPTALTINKHSFKQSSLNLDTIVYLL